jgi:hypothetical protein
MEPDVPVEPIPEIHKLGAILAAAGAYLLFYRAQHLPASAPAFDRPVCLLLACILLAYAWAALMAMLARSMEWTPKTCRMAGYPLLLAVGALGILVGPPYKLFDTGEWLILAELTGRLCRRIAFPELGWSGKDPEHPPMSIDPRLHSRPDALAKR